MVISLNAVLGMFGGVLGAVTALATLLLVWWQAPHRRDNQLMLMYLGSVALWGFAEFVLHLFASVGWDAQRPLQVLAFLIGLNSLSTFVVAAHFARVTQDWRVRSAIVLGALCLAAAVPLLVSNQAVVLTEVTPDGRFMIDFAPLAVPLVMTPLLYYLGAFGVVWRYRAGPAGQLVSGMALMVAAFLASVLPLVGSYAIDVAVAALASVLFARSILQEHLFGPLARLNAELAASNAQLTELSAGLQATAEDLRIARDAAETASRAKSAFLANMSHELRTPLTAIIGYTDLVEAEVETLGREELMDDLDRIRQSGQHLLTLISDVLDLSKVEAGHITLYPEQFAVRAVVEQVVAAVQPVAARNGNSVTVALADGLPMFWTDQTKLRQILLNLAHNACKFTSGGAVSVTVRPAETSRGAGARFEIADTGIGMLPEQVAQLFQDFYQGDASTTRRFGGTGLGLALSRRLCHVLGGEITVTSAEGKGSTFEVIVPAALAGAGVQVGYTTVSGAARSGEAAPGRSRAE